MTMITQDIRVYQELRARLLNDDPDLDETTLADTLEGATDLQGRIVNICRAAREADAQADVVAIMAKDMAARKKRHEARSDRLRSIALWAMQEADISKIAAPDLTIGISKGRTSVVISDPMLIPPHLVEYQPTPNKTLIKAELETGEVVPGASLSNSGPSLSIRSK
jgi:hypothetical protein